jgi:hypothetical protein
MDIFRKHEMFEIEVLDKMKSARALDPLVFGGGTMLRLCHELNRYSVDLDFWFLKQKQQDDYYDQMCEVFAQDYDVTDSQIKHFSILFELRTASYPKRLKIEIRREVQKWDYQEKIAFSRFSTRQVALKAHTLNQTMKNKIKAFLDRGEIRDSFDIEFLLRRGVELPGDTNIDYDQFLKKLNRFKDNDFKIKLGSILESEFREYYVANRFSYLKEKLSTLL